MKPWMSISVSNTSSPPKSMRALWCLFWVGFLGFGGSNILACQMEQWLKPLNTSHISPSGQEAIESVFANSEVRSCWPMCTTAARPEWGKEKTCCPFGGSRIAVCCSFYCENVIQCCNSNFSTYLFSRSHTVFHLPGLLLWYCRVSLLLNLEPHTSPRAQPRLLQNRWETNNNCPSRTWKPICSGTSAKWEFSWNWLLSCQQIILDLLTWMKSLWSAGVSTCWWSTYVGFLTNEWIFQLGSVLFRGQNKGLSCAVCKVDLLG